MCLCMNSPQELTNNVIERGITNILDIHRDIYIQILSKACNCFGGLWTYAFFLTLKNHSIHSKSLGWKLPNNLQIIASNNHNFSQSEFDNLQQTCHNFFMEAIIR